MKSDSFYPAFNKSSMSKYGYDDTRRTRFRRLLLGMGVAMLLFFLLLKNLFCGAIAIYLAPLETDIRLFSFVVCCGTGLSCVSEDARSGSMVYSEWSDRDRREGVMTHLLRWSVVERPDG